MPNLPPDFPVVIFSRVSASISGFSLTPIFVFKPLLKEYSSIKSISSKFSTFIDLIC